MTLVVEEELYRRTSANNCQRNDTNKKKPHHFININEVTD